MEERLLLRPIEVSKALGVSRAKAYELIAGGILPSVRLGDRAVRVPLKALQHWIEERTAASRPRGGAPSAEIVGR